jgi:hypothetical protein
MAEVSSPRGVDSEINDAAQVRGRHYSEWNDVLVDLLKAGAMAEYMELLRECISATEREGCAWSVVYGPQPGTPPKYTIAAAKAYRQLGRVDLEIAVLERYLSVPGNDEDARQVRTRLADARRSSAQRDAARAAAQSARADELADTPGSV